MSPRVFLNFLAFVTFFVELQQFTEALNSAPITPITNHSTQLYTSTLNGTSERIKETNFILRKCCGPRQFFKEFIPECANFTTSTGLPLETSTDNLQQIFLLQENLVPAQYSVNDINLKTGFASSCTRDSDISDTIDQASNITEYRFFPLATGQLLVPYRFYFLEPEDYCIEDVFPDEKIETAERMLYFCQRDFPETAIDEKGKLQLDFIQTTLPSEVSTLVGRTVVRKCCPRNHVYVLSEWGFYKCENSQGLATKYFDDLQYSRENEDEFFFRVGGKLNCEQEQETTLFQLVSGSLLVRTNNTEHWNEQLISTDNYCIEDIVRNNLDGLPITFTTAKVCSNEVILKEPDSPYLYWPDPNLYYDESNALEIPKCCPHGYAIEGKTCQPQIYLSDSERIISQALNYGLLTTHNISSVLIPNSSLLCGYESSHSLFEPGNETFVRMKFQLQENNLSVLVQFYEKNYWDYDFQPSFCFDMHRFHENNIAVYIPEVFVCYPESNTYVVGIHSSVILCISSAALFATFVIYFFVPASGATKLVTGGRNAGKGRRTSMAMMLTGRILLSHVLTLALAYISLAIAQHLHIVHGNRVGKHDSSKDFCTSLGFVTYGLSLASFSWLTVYCFDYCRIFSGSFKVSSEILFLPYSAFGWGIPILGLVTVAITQFHSADLGIRRDFHPNMGLLGCWFPGKTSVAKMIYFDIPMSVLILLNIVFFIILMLNQNLMNCWKKGQQQMAVRANRNAPNVSNEKQDLRMAIKLLFITGVPWIFEMTATWLPAYLTSPNNALLYLFEITNLFNSLRGVIIFIIFVVLQRDVRRYLLKKISIHKKNGKNDNPLTSLQNDTYSTSVL